MSDRNSVVLAPCEPSPSSFILLSDLQARKLPEVRYVAKPFLPFDDNRPHAAGGDAGVGKTALCGRQLVADVASLDRNFLGFETQHGSVLLLTSEGTGVSLQRDFSRLGYDAKKHHPIYLLYGENASLKNAKQVLETHDDVILFVVECLPDFLPQLNDSNSADNVRQAMLKFSKDFVTPYCHRMVTLALIHIRKRHASSLRKAISGSLQWGGRMGNVIGLRKYSEDDTNDTRRVIETENRIGEDIPPTFLLYDPVTRRSTLGVSVAQDRAARKHDTAERIENSIVEYLAEHPNASFENDVLPALNCNSDTARRVFKNMLRGGLIVHSGGSGKRGDPLLYGLPAIPVEGEIQHE